MFLTAANENLTGSKVREEGRACFGLQSMVEGADHIISMLRKQQGDRTFKINTHIYTFTFS